MKKKNSKDEGLWYHTFSSRALWCSNRDLRALSTSTSLETPEGGGACLFTTVILNERSWRDTKHSKCSRRSYTHTHKHKFYHFNELHSLFMLSALRKLHFNKCKAKVCKAVNWPAILLAMSFNAFFCKQMKYSLFSIKQKILAWILDSNPILSFCHHTAV